MCVFGAGEGGGIRGTVVARWTTGQQVQVERSNLLTSGPLLLSTMGIMHNNINLISSGCPRPSIAFHVQNRGLKHQSFIHRHLLQRGPQLYITFDCI